MGNNRTREDKKISGKSLEEGKVPKPKMKIEAKVLDGNSIEKNENTNKTDLQVIAEKKEQASKKEERKAVGWIISRLDEPKNVEYGNNTVRVSGRAKLKVADYNLLGELPTGLVLKKL